MIRSLTTTITIAGRRLHQSILFNSIKIKPSLINSFNFQPHHQQKIINNSINSIILRSTYSTSSTSSSLSSPSPSPSPLPNSNSNSNPIVDEGVTSRLKALFRTNGWSALVIYLALSLADFSLTFLLIYAVGADRVREAEDWVLETLGWRRKDGEPGKVKRAVTEWKEHHQVGSKSNGDESTSTNTASKSTKSKPTIEATASSSSTTKSSSDGYSAIATTAVLAYAIHKTLLLPVRLGITVAITPRIVRKLQAWGWKVGYAGIAGAGVTTAAATGTASGGTSI